MDANCHLLAQTSDLFSYIQITQCFLMTTCIITCDKQSNNFQRINRVGNTWRVSSQNALYPFWSIWDIWDLSCWYIKKIIRKFVILLIITSKIFLYIMSNVSLERFYFVLYDGALTLKMSNMALNAFCDKTLHIYIKQNCTHKELQIQEFGSTCTFSWNITDSQWNW